MGSCKKCFADIWYIKAGTCPLLNIFNNKNESRVFSLVTAKTRDGGITAGEISVKLNIASSHVYPILNKLIKLGFLEKLSNGKYISKCVDTKIMWVNGYIQVINCPLREE